MASKSKTLTYSEKLRDPRWQKMRLNVMGRDCFACRHCSSKEKTLNVHHHYYTKGAMPWEYDPDVLITLCEDCHAMHEARMRHIAQGAGESQQAALLMMQIPAMLNEEGSYSGKHAEFISALEAFVECSQPWSLGHGNSSLEALRDTHTSGMVLISAITKLCSFLDLTAISESLSEVEE